jgi:hypothetical protein
MLELEHGFRVVDVHARLEPDEDRRQREGLGDPERLEREMHQAGVVRSLVFPSARDDNYLAANNAVARMSVGRPFVAVARINGARDAADTPVATLRNLTAHRTDDHTSPADIEKYAYDDRFVGFKLHPARAGLPLMLGRRSVAGCAQCLPQRARDRFRVEHKAGGWQLRKHHPLKVPGPCLVKTDVDDHGLTHKCRPYEER